MLCFTNSVKVSQKHQNPVKKIDKSLYTTQNVGVIRSYQDKAEKE